MSVDRQRDHIAAYDVARKLKPEELEVFWSVLHKALEAGYTFDEFKEVVTRLAQERPRHYFPRSLLEDPEYRDCLRQERREFFRRLSASKASRARRLSGAGPLRTMWSRVRCVAQGLIGLCGGARQ